MNGKVFGLLALTFLVAMPASAATIFFSGDASDDDAPLSAFDGRIDYTFSGGVLQLTLWNDTTDYTLSVVGFNTSDNVDDIDVQEGVDDEPLYDITVGGPISNGGFGTFDWSLDLGSGNDGVAAGAGATFSFDVASAGPALTEDDFFSHFSIHAQNETGVAVIHFARGPGDDSAWVIPGGNGDVVPEPVTVAMMGIGAALLGARRLGRNGKA